MARTYAYALSTFAFAVLVLLTGAAMAQEPQFSGRCTDYTPKGEDACKATQWCRWSKPRQAITFPDGTSAQSTGRCGFKPFHKARWEAKAQTKQ